VRDEEIWVFREQLSQLIGVHNRLPVRGPAPVKIWDAGGVVGAVVPLSGGKAVSGALAYREAAIAPIRACPVAQRSAAVKALTH
jgi:hypothetical protein